MRTASRTVGITVLLAALAGCGGDGDPTESSSTTTATAPESPPRVVPRLPRLRCPADAANCEVAAGTIVYVERVDPDGDGDAHFVLASRESITAPGVSVIDVREDLRPRPLPGVGDLLTGAGPVYEGSYGQSQIQADEIAFERVR